MKDAATRQKEKAERKREKAKQDRQSASKVLASQRERMQALRSKVFAAARDGDADAVRKGVWEQDVDPAGGEIKPGCDHLVRQKPADPRETLLHIAARRGDKELVEWLGSHSLFLFSRCRPPPIAQTTLGGDMEERTSEDHTAFHVALNHGHIPVLKYFFETYPTNDEDTDGIYTLPGSSSLLSLAVGSCVAEAVWMILDNKLFQRKEIVDVWKNLSSPAGTATFIKSIERKNVKSGEKKREVFDEIINLIASFGGFTRPPTLGVHDPMNSSDSIPSHESPANSSSSSQPEQLNQRMPKRDASGQPPSETRPDASQNARSGRGRGRGRGRERGRGRGRGRS